MAAQHLVYNTETCLQRNPEEESLAAPTDKTESHPLVDIDEALSINMRL